mgnify:CR=1 FL=1
MHQIEKNQVRINFPTNFIRDGVAKKYSEFLKKINKFPFQNITDFILHSVQEIDSGNLTVGSVEQSKYRGKVNRYKGSQVRTFMIQPREINLTFKSMYNHLNWFIMLDEIVTFHTSGYPDTHIDPIIVTFLDYNGNPIRSISFELGIYTGLSGLDLTYTDTTNDVKTFTVTLALSGAKILTKN